MAINNFDDLKAKLGGNKLAIPALPMRLSKQKKRPVKMSRRKKFK